MKRWRRCLGFVLSSISCPGWRPGIPGCLKGDGRDYYPLNEITYLSFPETTSLVWMWGTLAESIMVLVRTQKSITFAFVILFFRYWPKAEHAFHGTLGSLTFALKLSCPMAACRLPLPTAWLPLVSISLLWQPPKPTACLSCYFFFPLNSNKIVLELPFKFIFKMTLLLRLRTPKAKQEAIGLFRENWIMKGGKLI